MSDPYAHRKHRLKYQQGYGAEGATRGKNNLPNVNVKNGKADGNPAKTLEEVEKEQEDKECIAKE